MSGILIFFLVIIGLILFTLYNIASGKGMCKWTAGDGLGMYFVKQLGNSFTFGILGVIMFFTTEDCKPPRGQMHMHM